MRPAPHVRWVDVADEILVLELESGALHLLDRPAAAVWRRLDGETTDAEIVRSLADEFDADPDRVALDLCVARRHAALAGPCPERATAALNGAKGLEGRGTLWDHEARGQPIRRRRRCSTRPVTDRRRFLGEAAAGLVVGTAAWRRPRSARSPRAAPGSPPPSSTTTDRRPPPRRLPPPRRPPPPQHEQHEQHQQHQQHRGDEHHRRTGGRVHDLGSGGERQRHRRDQSRDRWRRRGAGIGLGRRGNPSPHRRRGGEPRRHRNGRRGHGGGAGPRGQAAGCRAHQNKPDPKG